ncbi:MAG: hypothetical protein RR893_13375 [Clostridia bacterium]
MKRIIILVLAGVMLAFSASAQAADIPNMSDDALLALRAQIEAEVDERALSVAYLLPMGTYVVGTDLKEGGYLISAAKEDNMVIAEIFASEEGYASTKETKTDVAKMFDMTAKDMLKYVSSYETLFLNDEDDKFISLTAGQVLNNSGKIRLITTKDEPWHP